MSLMKSVLVATTITITPTPTPTTTTITATIIAHQFQNSIDKLNFDKNLIELEKNENVSGI